MLLWTIKAVIVSLMLIAFLHYIYNTAVDAFTSPAVKDMVQRPKDEYESIMKTINKEPPAQPKKEEPQVDMRSQLETFLVGQLDGRGLRK